MNWNLIGHEPAVRLLKEHIKQGNLRQAYLLTGPQGIGKRTLALRIVQAVNCQQLAGDGEPCYQCRSCQQIERMQHPDLSIIQAEQVAGSLKVDQIRDLQRSLSLAPYEANYRAGILLRFEEASAGAANALLKTLEEPPARVILILTAENSELLLPTIVSRCEVIRLRPASIEQAAQGLQQHWGIAPEQAQLLAHISGGRVGYALQLYQSPEQMEQRQIWLDDLHRLLTAGRVERFAYASRLSSDKNYKETLQAVLPVWISLWRDVLLVAAGASTPVTNLDRRDEIEAAAGRLGIEGARCAIQALERTLHLLSRNVNARLSLEVLMLDLPVL